MTKRKEPEDENTEKVTAERYERKKLSMPLECRLTESELKASAKTLAEALRHKGALESQLETFKAQIKSQITQSEGTIAEHANRLNSEKEFRSVECEMTLDYHDGFKTTVRKDTGEEVRKEKITDAERQMHLGDSALDLRGASEK
jgi:hypothetical protein